MPLEEQKDVIVYLQSKIEELESKKLCECAEEPPEKTDPTVTYKATPREVFVTNYDEDEECISCSAQLFFLILSTLVGNIEKITKILLYFLVFIIFWFKIL